MPWVCPLMTPSQHFVTNILSCPFLSHCNTLTRIQSIIFINPWYSYNLHIDKPTSICCMTFPHNYLSLGLTFTSGALPLSSMLWIIHHIITLFTHYNHQASGSKPRYCILLPLGITPSLVFSKLNRNAYASHMALSSSHVASYGLRWFHCTFT